VRGEGSGPPLVIRTNRPEGLFALVVRAGRGVGADRASLGARSAGPQHPLVDDARRPVPVPPWSAALFGYAAAATTVSVGYTCLAVAAVRLAEGLVAHAPLTTVSGWGIFGVTAAVGRAAAAWHVARAETALGARVGVQLREEIAASLLAQGPTDEARVGALVLAIRAVERACVFGVLGSFRAGLMALPLVVVLLTQLPRGALAALLFFVPFTFVLARLRRRVRATERRALDRGAELDAHLDDLLRHIDLFRVHGTHAELRAATRVVGEASARATVTAAGVRVLASSVNEVLAALAVAAFAFAAAAGVWVMDPGRAAPALAVAFLLYRPLRDFGDARAAWLAGESALGVLAPQRGSLSSATERGVTPGTQAANVDATEAGTAIPLAPGKAGRLVVADFGAARTSTRWSFSVEPFALAVIVGPVGSGKTTLFRALLGLEASVGAVRYDERAWHDAPVGQRPFAWAPQEAPLVSGDLRRNLALGGPEIEEAAALLRRLAPGLGEALERGTPLSGGERALLAITRAVASGRPVLLLDEPAAHLDEEARGRVVALIRALRGSRTVLVISHHERLSEEILEPNRGDVVLRVPPSVEG
jgi:ABC-type transport system involved in cytochrome bd biosynthesis fused ATPase/permease subunit